MSKSEASFVCRWESCSAQFKTKTSLRCHIGSHPPQQVFICKWESCERQFGHMAQYLRHYKVHARQRPFACDECGDSFSRRTYLKEHVLSHSVRSESVKEETEEVIYTCPVDECGKSYRHRQSLHWHKMAHHKDFQSEKIIKAEENSSPEMKERGTKRKQVEQNPRSSEEEDEEEDEDEVMKRKRRKEDRQGPFACPVKDCKSVVKLYSSLRRHLRIHNSKSERKSGNVASDTSVKSAPDSFPCLVPGCGKVYRYSRSLLRHSSIRHSMGQANDRSAGKEKPKKRKEKREEQEEEEVDEEEGVEQPREMTASEMEAETISAVASLSADIQAEHIKLEFVNVSESELHEFVPSEEIQEKQEVQEKRHIETSSNEMTSDEDTSADWIETNSDSDASED